MIDPKRELQKELRPLTQPLPRPPYIKNPIHICSACGVTGLNTKMYLVGCLAYCGRCLPTVRKK